MQRDLARTTFQLLALGVLIVSTFWIVRPFLMATTWAGAIAVATWPLLLRLQAVLGGRRSLAVGAMTLTLMLVLLVPFYFGVTSVVESAGRTAEWSKALATVPVPAPPDWVATLPLVGPRIVSRWQRLAATTPDEVAAHLAPYAREGVVWFVEQVGGAGLLLVQIALTLVVVALLYANGDAVVEGADRFARRLAGAAGPKVVHLAARAVRAVALGVVVTAIAQTVLTGIGLAVAGVPFVTILCVLVFILSVAQVGPTPVLVPAIIWVYARSGTTWGTAFLLWALVCATTDNILRPMLIKRGADLPLLLIFAGVVGGLVAFGVIGLFIGPVVLAVAYTLLADWVTEGEALEQPGVPPPAA